MISTIKSRGVGYYCSNCQMRLPKLQPNCWFCGDWFSNYELLLIQETNEQAMSEIKGDDLDESNVSRTN